MESQEETEEMKAMKAELEKARKALKEAEAKVEAAREEGRKEGEKSAREKKEKEAIQAEKGKFFTPWSEIWDQQCVDKSKCNGALDRVSRTKDFAENIPEYKDILDRSKSQKTKAAELDQDFSDLNVNDNGDHSRHKKKKRIKRNRRTGWLLMLCNHHIAKAQVRFTHHRAVYRPIIWVHRHLTAHWLAFCHSQMNGLTSADAYLQREHT